MQSLAEYEQEILAEIELEVRNRNPVHQAFRLCSFVSYSAGRGRRRKEPREVTLVIYKSTGKAVTFENFAADTAGEYFDGTYPDMSEHELLSELSNVGRNA